MLRINLDDRLKTIASFVRPDKIAADVGTDHALLPCYLKMQGQRHVIASDIAINPLEAAKKTAEQYGISDIELILCDGLSGIDYAEDIIIAGMGGETIAEIVKNCSFINHDTRLILQPMTRHAELRRSMYRMGFEILEEKPAKVDGKIYTVMLFRHRGEEKEIDDLFAFLGRQTDSDYIAAQLKKVRKMLYSKPQYSGLIAGMEAILNDSKEHL